MSGKVERTGETRACCCRLALSQICAGCIRGDEGDSLALLADSIARRGLLQPIVVRRTAHGYALVCGRRRLEACRRLGMEAIDAIVIEADEEEALLCRLEEHHTARIPHFLTEAEEIAGRCGEDAADKSALGQAFFALRQRALGFGERVRRIIRTEGLNPAQCAPLYAIESERLREEAALIIAQRELTPGQAWRLVCGRAPQHGQNRVMERGMEKTEAPPVPISGRRRRRRVEMHMETALAAGGNAAPRLAQGNDGGRDER